MCTLLTLTAGNNQGTGDVEYGKISDIYFPPPFMRLFEGETCYAFWQGGLCTEGTPEVAKVMQTCVQETGSSKLFSATTTADDPADMVARANYVLASFDPLVECCALLADGCLAGQAAASSPQTQRGHTAFVPTNITQIKLKK